MKIINDTLKNSNGDYSRKSLTTLVSFANSILMGWYIILQPEVNNSALTVCLGFLGLGGGTLALTVIDKIKNKTTNEN